MADFYSHGVHGNIVKAKRVQPVSELHALQHEDGTIVSTVFKGIRSQLMIGKRVTSYSTYLAPVNFGQLANGVSIDTNPKYRLLNPGTHGKKLPYPEDETHFAVLDTGLIVNKIYTGISTVGIGYVPPDVEKDTKEVRRWPRNWYGDNIKS